MKRYHLGQNYAIGAVCRDGKILESREIVAELNRLTDRLEAAEKREQALAAHVEAITDTIHDLIAESVGVVGLHMNGDVAPWEELQKGGRFESWLQPLDDTPETSLARHPDDAAVDKFAGAMKAKLSKAREKGRGGWENTHACRVRDLVDMLIGHLGKGNEGTWEDVANFCMMLHQRGDAPAELADGMIRFKAQWLEGLLGAVLEKEPQQDPGYCNGWNACLDELRRQAEEGS